MNYTCIASGYSSPASTKFGRYCRPHVAQLRRHGAIGQTGITKAELKAYGRIVSARLEKNRDKPLLTQLEARWGVVQTYAATVRDEARSKPIVRYRREAAVETLRIGKNVNARDVIETVLAMYVMQDQEPRRFKSDQAFKTQLVRRVRGLTRLNADAWTDAKTGKRKLVYRDLSQRTVIIMGGWIAEALGPAGIMFARLERKDHEKEQQALLAFRQTLDDIE
ncbi:hypothetical protein BB934_32755 (plasmid) [Microvirga ossetica]|uniref:Uncharacterized protein n=1 Tax=Microvirga ossetica TaxID=1882682 RepID=A0A1B2ESN9_9HYPH|nr:hypothetical protein [Microvirga ossetica]ANY82988.1 hypothetical protein BB934_32755 [Microvirga ossetica]